ncbi:small multi-drug export protein [Candidatus Berkelbacteria bacterium]|nr:small multi-drug export protein [Candidatus Berkelbacteria bacterium]
MSLTETVAEYLANISPEIATLLIAALPFGELRGALPIAITVFKLPILAAYFWSVAGNMLPVFFILWLIGPLSHWLSIRSKMVKNFFDWFFERTHKKTNSKIQQYGAIALVLFVAIPLPFTGAWTGSVAAYLFGIKKRVAMPLIYIGVLISGFIVSLLTVGAVSIF